MEPGIEATACACELLYVYSCSSYFDFTVAIHEVLCTVLLNSPNDLLSQSTALSHI